MTFASDFMMNKEGAYRVDMPGITIGDCKIPQKYNGGEVLGVNGQELMASYPWSVRFYEGRYNNTFMDSYMIATNWGRQTGIVNPFKLVLDRSNGLKRGCPANATWSVYRYITTPEYPDNAFPTMAPTLENTAFNTQALEGLGETVNTAYPTSMPTGFIDASEKNYSSGYVGYLVEKNEWQPYMCFIYESALSFLPALQQFDTSINLTLNLGFTINVGDNIVLKLPGFTNKETALPANPGFVYGRNQTVFPGSDAVLLNVTSLDTVDVSQVSIHADFNTGFEAWTGIWNEGDKDDDYVDSYVRLYPGKTFPAGTPFTILIDRCPNHLVSLYGRQKDYKGFNIVVTGNTYFTNITHPDTVQPIGDSCSAFNYCNGNGNCDYATSTCKCFDGYGSAKEFLTAVASDFQPDCSSRSCPIGPAFAALPKNPTTGMHREIECSSNGRCNRNTGSCECFDGFEGRSCDKMMCPRPGPSEPICSGRGVCKKMSRLGYDSQALPLSASTTEKYETAAYNGTRNSWDADLGHACVCDSSWDVGLANNQTQLAEYFGPSCEFRRCPR